MRIKYYKIIYHYIPTWLPTFANIHNENITIEIIFIFNL